MVDAGLAARVDAVRRFNRFYTQKIGVLEDGLLDSPFSLAEARVLYEIAQRDRPTASQLGKELGLDAGYLSRILGGFERRRLLRRTPSPGDARQSLLSLTKTGRAAFRTLDRRSRGEMAGLLKRLPVSEQERLVGALASVERLLAAPAAKIEPILLRPHRAGDMGWIVARHGALYAEEYGWDQSFEALVAEIAAQFIRCCDPARERCWIAELGGESVGAVCLVKQSKRVAKLRLLLVEPRARGLGIGARLVEECLRFARQAGYRKVILWTNSALHAARRLYEAAGFRLVREEPHHSFGQDLVGQYWERRL